VDQEVKWEKDKTGFQRVLVPPSPEKLKIIHDLVAGVTGYSAERGDQLVIETLPFETTLLLEPPQQPGTTGSQKPVLPLGLPFKLDSKTLMTGGGALAGVIVLLFAGAMLLRSRKKTKADSVTGPVELPAGGRQGAIAALTGSDVDSQIESQLAEREALQHKLDAQALAVLKLTPVITKKAEVLAKHLRDKVSSEPEMSARVLRGWIREEDN